MELYGYLGTSAISDVLGISMQLPYVTGLFSPLIHITGKFIAVILCKRLFQYVSGAPNAVNECFIVASQRSRPAAVSRATAAAV